MTVKRKRVESLPESFTLAEAAPSSRQSGPFAVYFASGLDPTKEAAAWTAYRHQNGQHVLVGRTEDMSFVGKNADLQHSEPPACRYALGVLDKLTGVMQYSTIQGGSIMRMEPHLHLPVAVAPAAVNAAVDTSPAGKAAAHSRLINLFGSERAKRQLSAQKAASVNAEALGSPDAIKGLLAAANDKAVAMKATREDVMAQTAAARNLPPHHLEATNPVDAYRLDDLIPSEVKHNLQVSRLDRGSHDAEYRNTVLRDRSQVPDMVLARLSKLPQGEDKDRERKAGLRCLAMLSALLSLLQQPSHLAGHVRPGSLSAMADLSRRCHIQEDVLRILLDKFYDYSRGDDDKDHYSQAPAARTLMTLHALALLLIFDKFAIGPAEFDSLRSLLKQQPANLAKLFRELGCTTSVAVKASSTALPQFKAVLMAPTTPVKTLAQYLPSLGKAGKSRR